MKGFHNRLDQVEEKIMNLETGEFIQWEEKKKKKKTEKVKNGLRTV